jgi:hypothetical protein
MDEIVGNPVFQFSLITLRLFLALRARGTQKATASSDVTALTVATYHFFSCIFSEGLLGLALIIAAAATAALPS